MYLIYVRIRLELTKVTTDPLQCLIYSRSTVQYCNCLLNEQTTV